MENALSHLLSKEEEVRAVVYCSVIKDSRLSGGDALRGDTVPVPNTMVKT